MAENMQPTERDQIELAQAQLADAKKALRALIKTLTGLAATVQATAGNTAANATMRLKGQVGVALGILDSAHADASDALDAGFSDGGKLIAYGPGR